MDRVMMAGDTSANQKAVFLEPATEWQTREDREKLYEQVCLIQCEMLPSCTEYPMSGWGKCAVSC